MENKAELIFLEPVFHQMIWGGSRLREEFGYEIPGEDTGECWAVSAHPNGDCRISGGRFEGMRLSVLWDTRRELFGGLPGKRFPLLVKIIDAKQDLSIQVHPDDAYAAVHENGASGKMECWYVLDAEEGGDIVIGHHARDRKEAERMIREKRWEEFLRVIPVKKGDFFQINPGCLHAIRKGTMILETQQNSDITYRVYDYDRKSGGKLRELHQKQSLEVIRAPFEEEETKGCRRRLPAEGGVRELLVECSRYSVERIAVEDQMTLDWGRPFVNVSVVGGSGTADGIPVKKGTHFLVPSGFGKLKLCGGMELICSYV